MELGGTLGKMGVERRNERSVGHYSQRLRLVERGVRMSTTTSHRSAHIFPKFLCSIDCLFKNPPPFPI